MLRSYMPKLPKVHINTHTATKMNFELLICAKCGYNSILHVTHFFEQLPFLLDSLFVASHKNGRKLYFKTG